MKKLAAYFTLAFAICVVPGCDYVSDPIPPGTSGPIGPIDTSATAARRKVLLEDFTGHRCNNCPEAARVASDLQGIYGEELIVVGVHVTSTFAAPLNPPAADGRYSTDFRTPAGNTYETAFNVAFLPAGSVSRKPFNSSVLLGQSAWGSAVAAIIGEDPLFDIFFEQLDHNATANTVSSEVKVVVLQPITENHNLTIYLTEDHVIDWQLDDDATPPDVSDYEHRHVLRTNVNGTWGVPLADEPVNVGDTLTFSYPGFAMNPAWNADNCALVAYVYNVANNEVMQVEERKFQP